MKLQLNDPNYYQRSEVSNSDLTTLKNLLHPHPTFGNKERAFRFGSLVDAIITEPHRVNHYQRTVDNETYAEEEFNKALEMNRALKREAQNDPFLAYVLTHANTQIVMVNHDQPFLFQGVPFTLNTRCKWDWFLPIGYGGDLKTTAAATQREFEEAIDFFDWDRSRAWYMDIAHSTRDFIYAISKKNHRIFKKFIQRDDTTYKRGKEKYNELAFQYWCYF